MARKFADWAKKGTDKLTDEQFQKMLQCEYGGMGDAMARLYAATGNRDYLALAKRFDHEGIFAPLAEQRDELAGKHVNTQLPKIIAAARLYELTGEERYATIAGYFYSLRPGQGGGDGEIPGSPGRHGGRSLRLPGHKG